MPLLAVVLVVALIAVLVLAVVLVLIVILVLVAVLVSILVIHIRFLRLYILAAARYPSLPQNSGFILGLENQTHQQPGGDGHGDAAGGGLKTA